MTTLNFYTGDDLLIPVTFLDSTGVAVDITSYKLYFSIVAHNTADATFDNALIKLTVGSGEDLAHSDPTHGITLINIANTVMDDLTPNNYLWKLQILNANGKYLTVGTGIFTVKNYSSSRSDVNPTIAVTLAENAATVAITLNNNILSGSGSGNASDIETDTENFTGNLTAADDTVQKALETLDALVAGGILTEIDGGSAGSVYLNTQTIDGGNA